MPVHILIDNLTTNNSSLANKEFCLVAYAETVDQDSHLQALQHIQPLLSMPFKASASLSLRLDALGQCCPCPATLSPHKEQPPIKF